ncbi:glycosyltransferase family 39 protein [Gordonia alkanivorans]|uniref:ArnT family glycosyltransferase n=1 Tax=Gordonia alkanivorans TaxID=84096 RepID=UPI0024482C03|nr:glycosyltransferase family 39 protein [Gordonia alkanivorans]MDH3016030.1 glycosyltransferase family 39 protein [Gordonia alkanivorans]MDH3040870.1 glycosyltransferase family 39 protein [Gordonia alkanivorans]
MSRRLQVGVVIFLAAWLPYLIIGVYLATEVHWFFGDALSRVQSAQSVLFSRSPHLSAIGFVFTPLTAIVQLPLVALSPWWPEMTTQALSAVIMSSVFMAGSVVQVSGITRDRGLDPVVAGTFTVCYAANPMVVLYAANGMSEAPYLFFLAWASRRLIRWISTDDVHELVVTGIALALAYLTRYDGGAAALAAGLVVGWVTYHRRDSRKRLSRSLVDVTLVVAPSALAFIAWAATGWLITGNAFAQFTSEYGNAAIIEQSGGSGSSTTRDAILFSVTEMAILAPLLPILVVGLIGVRARRRRLQPMLPGLMIVAVLAFQVYGYSQGSTYGFLRFYMTVILLAAIVALMSVPLRSPIPMRRAGAHADLLPARPYASRWGYKIACTVAVVVMAAAIPVTAMGMTSPKYAPQEFAVGSVVDPRPQSVEKKYLDEQRVVRSFSTERALAKYLDSLELPDGAVLSDTVYGFAVVAQSERPRQFVIPSDRDFAQLLNDPVDGGVQYFLTVPAEGRGASDVINQRYPTMYENGAQIGVRVLEAPNDGADLPDWRVYRITG